MKIPGPMSHPFQCTRWFSKASYNFCSYLDVMSVNPQLILNDTGQSIVKTLKTWYSISLRLLYIYYRNPFFIPLSFPNAFTCQFNSASHTHTYIYSKDVLWEFFFVVGRLPPATLALYLPTLGTFTNSYPCVNIVLHWPLR